MDCPEDQLGDMAGYHVFLGAGASTPRFPLKGYIEGRLGWLAGDPGLHTRSIYLGIELNL